MEIPWLSNWRIRNSKIHLAAGVMAELRLEKIVEVRYIGNLVFNVPVPEKLECALRGSMSV